MARPQQPFSTRRLVRYPIDKSTNRDNHQPGGLRLHRGSLRRPADHVRPRTTWTDTDQSSPDTKTCPYCAETVLAAVALCISSGK